MNDIDKAKVFGLLATVSSRVEAEDIQADTLLESLGLDSLAGLELKIRLANELGCKIPNEALLAMRTVQDVLSYIDHALLSQSGQIASDGGSGPS